MSRTFLYQLNVTRDCNLRCTHCYISSLVKKLSGQIGASDLLKTLSGVGDHMAVNGRTHAEIHIIGGEPTMLGAAFFDEVIPAARAILKEKAAASAEPWTFEIIIVTNLLSKEVLPIARHFDRVNTSWEPVSRFPKPKLEAMWRDSVRLLRDNGIDVGVTTSITKPVVAMGAAKVLDRLYGEEGISQIHFGFFIPSGDGATNQDAMFPAFHETSQFLIDSAEWYFAHRDQDPKLFVNPAESMLAAVHTGQSVDDVICPIIAGSMDIDWDGRSATCLEAGGNIDAKFVGNVLETSVTDVAQSPGFRKDVIKASRPHAGCAGCEEYSICRSGCGVTAKHWKPEVDADCPGFKGFIKHIRARHGDGMSPKYTVYRGKGC